MNYYNKYLKYKLKYLNLIGGDEIDELMNEFILDYNNIIKNIFETNKELLSEDDFPSTCFSINMIFHQHDFPST